MITASKGRPVQKTGSAAGVTSSKTADMRMHWSVSRKQSVWDIPNRQMRFFCAKENWKCLKLFMPNAGANRDLNTLIQVMKDNRAILEKTQQKMENLQAAIKAMKSSRLENERKQECQTKDKGRNKKSF
ncbi:MAG TPA: hypothetical protein VGY98_19545 [Verrucomicrobiae bacterium]|nr:hypothetical protein [Verrucomicrobiae bacterium]